MSIMIIMKKRFSIIIISIIACLLVVITILIIHYHRPKSLLVYNYKKHYSVIYDDYPQVSVKLWVNEKDNPYFDVSNIEKAVVTTDLDSYAVKISDASVQDELSYYNEQAGYSASYTVKWDFVSDDLITMNNAVLNVYFKSNESLSINIGNLCFQKAVNNHVAKVSKIQSIVNDLGELDTMVAIKMVINSEEDCTLEQIIPISSSITINNDYLLVNSNKEIDNETSYTEIFGAAYSPFNNSSTNFNTIVLNKKINTELVIPLAYSEKEFVDSLGFILVFNTSHGIVKQIVNPYCLFSTANLGYVSYEYKIVAN